MYVYIYIYTYYVHTSSVQTHGPNTTSSISSSSNNSSNSLRSSRALARLPTHLEVEPFGNQNKPQMRLRMLSLEVEFVTSTFLGWFRGVHSSCCGICQPALLTGRSSKHLRTGTCHLYVSSHQVIQNSFRTHSLMSSQSESIRVNQSDSMTLILWQSLILLILSIHPILWMLWHLDLRSCSTSMGHDDSEPLTRPLAALARARRPGGQPTLWDNSQGPTDGRCSRFKTPVSNRMENGAWEPN